MTSKIGPSGEHAEAGEQWLCLPFRVEWCDLLMTRWSRRAMLDGPKAGSLESYQSSEP